MAAQQPISPYHEFYQPNGSGNHIALFDHDGTKPLYEGGAFGNGLIHRIVQLNDVSALKQYLLRKPVRGLGADDAIYSDPFYTAACNGSTDALRILLEHHAIHGPGQLKAPNETDYLLLNEASRNAHVDTARFLLDSQPAYVDIHARKWDTTALLCAAASFVHLRDIPKLVSARNETKDYLRDRVARSEELIQLLLDRGACARDTTKYGNSKETVLSLAISRASPGLVKRLIDEGADVHAKTTRGLEFLLNHDEELLKNVTPLHVGSLYLNSEGIQILLDHRGSGVSISDMLSCRDSSESLPLHWAAGSFNDPENEFWARDDTVEQATETIKLLLNGNPTTINIPDKQGNTALHLASSGEARSGSQHSAVARAIVKLLLEHGADPSSRNGKGQTPLHLVTTDTTLMELLLAHGANLKATDAAGNIALHFAAHNLRYISAVRFLINRGADIHARNSKGNTPLHETAGGYYMNDSRRRLNGGSGSWRYDGVRRRGVNVTDYLIRLQNEMIGVFVGAGGDVDCQRNGDGKTPRMVWEETRGRWGKVEESRRNQIMGMGRGRGK